MAFRQRNVVDWFDEISRGHDYRREYGVEKRWSEAEQRFYNRYKNQGPPSSNLIAEIGDSILSELTVPNPYISVDARDERGVITAPLVETVHNGLMWDIDVPSQFEDAVLHTFLWGTGFFKLGFDSEFGYDPSLSPPGLEGMTFTQFNKKGHRIEFGLGNPGMPWVSAVLPHDMTWPWGTTRHTDQAEWCAHRVVRHIEDVKADPKYENTRSLQPTMSMKDWMDSYNSAMKPHRTGEVMMTTRDRYTRGGEARFVELFEIHDQRTGKIFVVASGHQKFLRNEPDLMQVDGLPFVAMSFVPRSRSVWTTSDAEYLRAHQAEMADIALQSMKIRRGQVPKFWYRTGIIDDSQLAKMQSDQVQEADEVNGAANQDFGEFTPRAHPELGIELERVRRDARGVSGMSRNQVGEFDTSSRRTATEAGIVEANSNQRMNRRQLGLSRAYIEVFTKLNSIVAEYWRIPQIVQVAGETGVPMWTKFVGPDL